MKKLVFIIDDDPIYLKFMENHFKQLGEYQTQIFQNGQAALNALQQIEPYLIILDHIFLNDPNKTGLDYLSAIRKQNSKVPVIYITIVNDELLRAKTKKLNVIDYILKDDAFLIYLRTALDKVSTPPKRNLLTKLFGR